VSGTCQGGGCEQRKRAILRLDARGGGWGGGQFLGGLGGDGEQQLGGGDGGERRRGGFTHGYT